MQTLSTTHDIKPKHARTYTTQLDVELPSRIPQDWFYKPLEYLSPYFMRKGFFGNFYPKMLIRLPIHQILRVLKYAGYQYRIEDGYTDIVIDKRLGIVNTEKTHEILVFDGQTTYKLFFEDLWQFVQNSKQPIVHPSFIPWKVPQDFQKKVGRTAKRFFYAPFEDPRHFLACIVKRKGKCTAIFKERFLPNTVGKFMDVKYPKGLPEGVYFGFVDVLFKEIASFSDCLFFDGKDITGEKFADRYAILQKILPEPLLFFKKVIRTIQKEGVYMDAESKGHSLNGLHLFRTPRQRRLPCVPKKRFHYYDIAGNFIVGDYTGVLLTIPSELFNNGDKRFVDHVAFVMQHNSFVRNKDKIQGFKKGEKGKVESVTWQHPITTAYKNLAVKRGPEWSKWLIRWSKRKNPKRSKPRAFLTASATNSNNTSVHIMYRYRNRATSEHFVSW